MVGGPDRPDRRGRFTRTGRKGPPGAVQASGDGSGAGWRREWRGGGPERRAAKGVRSSRRSGHHQGAERGYEVVRILHSAQSGRVRGGSFPENEKNSDIEGDWRPERRILPGNREAFGPRRIKKGREMNVDRSPPTPDRSAGRSDGPSPPRPTRTGPIRPSCHPSILPSVHPSVLPSCRPALRVPASGTRHPPSGTRHPAPGSRSVDRCSGRAVPPLPHRGTPRG